IVTPAHKSLLIDAGYGRDSRDAGRIMRAAQEAEISRIDYLLITHFHPDHVGGVPDLAARIPIGTFIDVGWPLGSDRMAAGSFRPYEPVRKDPAHFEAKPGDRLPLSEVEVDVISADGVMVGKPLKGGGRPTPSCAELADEPDRGTENFRSIGIRLK